MLTSCGNTCMDADIFNGKIKGIEDNAVQKEFEFKALEVNGSNFGYPAIQDSLVYFMNPQLHSHWYQVFNLNSRDEAELYVSKGNGYKEFAAISPIYNFCIENNDIKTVLFEPSKEQISVWNITKSLADKSTIIEKQIKMPWKKENQGTCFNELFMKDSCTIYAKVSAAPINKYDASLPYYQIRDLRNGEKISEIHVFKKTSSISKQNIYRKHSFTLMT